MAVRALSMVGLLVLAIYFNNASWLRKAPEEKISLLAHRGVHQNFSNVGLSNSSCTATKIDQPKHNFLENTIESMRQAFSHGADIVELDIHPTTDGSFAVFHDWTVDCRTEGTGVTRELSLSYSQSLDIGFGYTHDGGKTFPFRGMGVGKMPSLTEVLDTFSTQKFLLHIKSNSKIDAELLVQFLMRRPKENYARLMVYGSDKPIRSLMEKNIGIKGFTKNTIKQCLVNYELIGWIGYVPESCRNTIVAIPVNYAPYLWGWPRKFMSRLQGVGTKVMLVGPSNRRNEGIDDPDTLAAHSENFRGIIWTNKIEKIGSSRD